MSFMLDTNTVSYALRGVGRVTTHLRHHARFAVCISAITVAELRYGADKLGSTKLHTLIDDFVSDVVIEPIGALEAARYGRLYADLKAAGTPIGQFDTLTAAHALTLGLILVTSNTKHFAVVPGLTIEDWL